MQSEPKWTTLKGPFAKLDKLDKTDLRTSVLFAVITVAISLVTFPPATCASGVMEKISLSSVLLFVIQFPLNTPDLVYTGWAFGPFGGLLVLVIFYLVSFISKVSIFYSLSWFTRKTLGNKDVSLLHYLPSLLLACIIFYSFYSCSQEFFQIPSEGWWYKY